MRRASWAIVTFFITMISPHFTVAAKAQDHSSLFGAQDGLFAISETRDRSFIDAGIAYVNRATYVGSEDSDTRILPFIRADYKGRLFINPATGAGVYWRNTDRLRLATSLSFAVGRNAEDTPLIGEGGEVDSSVTVTNTLRYYLPFAAIDAITTLPVTGGFSGARFDGLITTEIKPIKGLRITPGIRATFGTAGWTGSLYNIDPEDLAAINVAGLNTFQADGGLLALGAHTAAYYELPNDFQLVGAINYSALQNDAKDSPLSLENNGLTVALGLARHF